MCTDLDRTLLPNGAEPESEQARKNFDVRDAAIRQAREHHQENTLYLAQGDFMGMNGNYSAGILEGVAHYIPQIEHWLRGQA